ncbi:oligopeptide transport ATP-binding protein OppF [Lachnospiraceae bacterium]|nr:oligopeptide transport ATP-binding protein OppF [Lachnospiraceae bacterium]
MSNLNQNKSGRVFHLPEHGPIDEKNGKEILLSVKNVDITFGKGENAVKAVKNANFDIYKGETFSLVGESGSGKTTVGRAVIRVNPCAGGEILYKGVRISGKIPRSLDREVIRNIQMVFQDPAASLNERATVDYIVSEGLYNFHLYKNEADRVHKVENMINEVGLLPEHLTRYPHEFSGGQRQRIGLARAMVMEPELVVADEPISALDVSIRAQVLNLLKKFQIEKNVTYLFIAHDLSIVRFISDRIGVIYKGNIVEIAEADELFEFPLHPYTHSLISAIPIPDPKLEKNKVLYTYDPSMHDYSTDQPELVNIGHDHFVYGNKKEVEEYKAIRAKGVPLKSINIVDPNAPQKQQDIQEIKTDEVSAQEDEFLKTPVHDTGSVWYKIISFLLPVLGLIAAFVFKHFHYYRNYTACKKGAIAGLIVIVAIIVLFILLLILAVV